MRQRVVLFLVMLHLQAADHTLIEMKEVKGYTQSQWEVFCAMRMAADLFFGEIIKSNKNFKIEADGKRARDKEDLEKKPLQYKRLLRLYQQRDSAIEEPIIYDIMPSEYKVDDKRECGLTFPERDFYLKEGLLFDLQTFSFICSLGTWQFADNGSSIHKCVQSACIVYEYSKKNNCYFKACKYLTAQNLINPWLELFEKIMVSVPDGRVGNLLRVKEVKGIKLPEPHIMCIKTELKEPSPVHLLGECSFDDSEPDMFDVPPQPWLRSLSIRRSLESIMPRRFSLPGARRAEAQEVIAEPEKLPFTPEEAQSIWAAMLAVKKRN